MRDFPNNKSFPKHKSGFRYKRGVFVVHQHRLVTADISNDAVQNIILDILQGGEKPELAITFVGGGHENLLTDKIRDSITHCISSVRELFLISLDIPAKFYG